MPTVFIVSCTGAGLIVGPGLGACSKRLIALTHSTVRTVRLAAPPLTAFAFGGLAWHFDYHLDLLPYCVLAAFAVILGLIDVVERRLPSLLTYSGIGIVGSLLVALAVLNSRGTDLLRAAGGMASIVAFYLVLALVSRGGLGAGDVKLGGLLGLALGWLSWSALVTGTFLGWLTASAVWLLLRLSRTRARRSLLPMGPFLLIGALLTIIAMPA